MGSTKPDSLALGRIREIRVNAQGEIGSTSRLADFDLPLVGWRQSGRRLLADFIRGKLDDPLR